MSLPPELRKKINLIEITTRRKVDSMLGGQYNSAFKGQGMTFAEFREYVPGDDVRAISWALTARMSHPHIKKFDEERELTLMLMVDVSGSLDFGSKNIAKGEVVANLSAMLGFAASKNNDHVGLILFSDRVEHYVAPRKGRSQMQRILTDIFYHKPESAGTDIRTAIDYATGILRKRATIFILSDFLSSAASPNFAMSLRTMAKKHEVVACTVVDPAEQALPNLGLIEMLDPETGDVMVVDTGNSNFRKRYAESVQSARTLRLQELKASGVDHIEIIAGPDYDKPLIEYFRRRGRR